MERKEFERKFKKTIKDNGFAYLKLRNGGLLIVTSVIVDKDDDMVLSLSDGNGIGYIPLKLINEVA